MSLLKFSLQVELVPGVAGIANVKDSCNGNNCYDMKRVQRKQNQTKTSN